MSSLTVPNLTLRGTKGSALTHDEADNNLEVLRNFLNSMAAILGVSLKTDGSLKDDSVLTDSIADRQVTQAKLAFDSLFVAADTGSTNELKVDFTPTMPAGGYADNQVFFVRVLNTNTAGATLQVGPDSPTGGA